MDMAAAPVIGAAVRLFRIFGSGFIVYYYLRGPSSEAILS